MPLTFFLSRPTIDGCILELSFNSKDQGLYLGFINQTGWNEQTKLGAFTGGKKHSIFLNMREMAMLINSLNTTEQFDIMHEYQNIKTYLFFRYNQDNHNSGLVFKKENFKVKAVIDQYDRITIIEYIKHAYSRMFEAIYSLDKKARAQLEQNNIENPQKNSNINQQQTDQVPF